MLGLVTFAIASAVQTDSSASSPADDSIVMWVAAKPEKCNFSLARKVTLEAFLRKPGEWVGQCIAVTGYWHGRALFESSSDAGRKYSQSSDELDGHRVGIYGQKDVLKAAPNHPRQFIAVGIANTCERLAEGAIMVMGYCHYTGGPIIAVAEMRPR